MRPDKDQLLRLWQARDEHDSAFMLDWLRRYPEEPAFAARYLCEWRITEATPIFVRLLGSNRTETRRTAARSLGRLGSPPEARGALIEAAAADPDPATRTWALDAIGNYRGDSEVRARLIASLGDRSVRVKSGAAVGLRKLGDLDTLASLKAERRRLKWRPVSWYWCRHAFDEAIRKLQNAE